jgi:hypothetical protein
MVFVMGLGCNLAKATAYAKVMNVASNIAAFTLFLGYGSVRLAAGLVMALGQVVGGVLGAHLVMQKGAGFVRPLYSAWSWHCGSSCSTNASRGLADARPKLLSVSSMFPQHICVILRTRENLSLPSPQRVAVRWA